MWKLLSLPLLMGSPAVAQDVRQFDLVCTADDVSMRYRIDLDRNEWCVRDCHQVRTIANVTSGVITLYRELPVRPNFTDAYTEINRLTGEWRWYHKSARSMNAMDHRGQCDAASFSGFPPARF
ncbi:hypothetical protein [Sphingosinithalassobacter portus]|uniref:hypothetical protein n=1 Tax=Stakelama portus TaxID=2676234 RepID=UPI0011AB7251|nr:hypothetical protein [Sphingosinithalassobacter portus]